MNNISTLDRVHLKMANEALNGGISAPIVGSQKVYHQSLSDIDNILADLREYAAILTPKHKKYIRTMIGNADNEMMTVDEIQKQFEMVKKIRDQVIDVNCTLLDDAEPKSITALVTATSSLITLFLRNQERINHLTEIAHLKESVIHAVSNLDKESQTRFFHKLDELSTSKL